MRPMVIPDELVAPDSVRRVIAAPDGDLTNDQIRPVESLIRSGPDGVALLSVMLELEPDEIEKLQDGRPVWLTFMGGIAPFDARVLDEGQVP